MRTELDFETAHLHLWVARHGRDLRRVVAPHLRTCVEGDVTFHDATVVELESGRPARGYAYDLNEIQRSLRRGDSEIRDIRVLGKRCDSIAELWERLNRAVPAVFPRCHRAEETDAVDEWMSGR
jgi:hypothetical protein